MGTVTFAQIYAGLQFDDHARWAGPTVTFSIPQGTSTFWSPFSYDLGDEPTNADYGVLNTDQTNAFIDAVGEWERLINLDLVQVPDTPANQGAIRIAFTDVNDYSDNDTIAYAYRPPEPGAQPFALSGDVWLDADLKDWQPDYGDFFYETVLHELGHALGLKHPFDGDNKLPDEFDNTRYTVMAYDDFADSNLRYFVRNGDKVEAHTYIVEPATPMLLDVIAIQGIYGANPNLAAGNSVYSFEEGATYIETIVDSGGNDTFDLSDHVESSIVNLTPGMFSSIDYIALPDLIRRWQSEYPDAAQFIADYLNKPGTYTWSNNVAIDVNTTIENVIGGAGPETVNGNAAANFLIGGGGSDVLFGSTGNDTLNGGSAGTNGNYLRGDEGDDSIVGGANFDDANGNMGNDTISTGGGDDYCVGGKDNDLLNGDGGVDLVYGNLGDDSCNGGDGADVVRGGQGNDTLNGGAGDDFVSGDRGDDTMVGGAGADIFHSSSDAGIDRVLDFNLAEGDRVQLDPGTTFTASQVGADTVISMTAGQVVLVGVSLSSLLANTIFGF